MRQDLHFLEVDGMGLEPITATAEVTTGPIVLVLETEGEMQSSVDGRIRISN
jgi:hypothetical protein